MSTGPHFILMHVRDMAQARQFYTETLGYTLETDSPSFVQFKTTDGAILALSTDEGSDPVELWWFVDDADATHETMRAGGVEISTPPKNEPFGRILAIKDPSGNILNMLQLPAGQ